ncbi:MAG: hypothetical protein AB7F86_01025 [Bdellovibrionales bacterium]
MSRLNGAKTVVLPVLLSLAVMAESLLAEVEVYSSRPKIEDLQPLHSEQGVPGYLSESAVRRRARGYTFVLAQLMAFFPEAEMYFLARDGEYLYDVARLLLARESEWTRLHLVPISTQLSTKLDMPKYLKQNGLTTENLNGRPAVFFDSCCAGTVPDAVETAFKDEPIDIRGFLITNTTYPASGIFHKASGVDGGDIEGDPHFTGSAVDFVRDSWGKIVDVRTLSVSTEVKEASMSYMKALRYHVDGEAQRKEFKEIVGHMRTVFSFLQNESFNIRDPQGQSALASLMRLRDHHGVSATAFLTDCGLMRRKEYASVSSNQLADLKEASMFARLDDTGKVAIQPASWTVPNLNDLPPNERILQAKASLTAMANYNFSQIYQGPEGVVASVETKQKYQQALNFWSKNFDSSWLETDIGVLSAFFRAADKIGQLDQALFPVAAHLDRSVSKYFQTDELTVVGHHLADAVLAEGKPPAQRHLIDSILSSRMMNSSWIVERFVIRLSQKLKEEPLTLFWMAAFHCPEITKNPQVLKWLRLTLSSMSNVSHLFFHKLVANQELPKHKGYEKFMRDFFAQSFRFSSYINSSPLSPESPGLRALGLDLIPGKSVFLSDIENRLQARLAPSVCEKALAAGE